MRHGFSQFLNARRGQMLVATMLAGTALYALPAVGQESLLPPGFNDPVKPEPKKPEPKAEPKKAEPKKAEPKKAEPKKDEPKKDEPRDEPKAAEPSSEPKSDPATPSDNAGTGSDPAAPSGTEQGGGDSIGESVETSRSSRSGGESTTIVESSSEDVEDDLEGALVTTRYDLPAGKRRSLSRVGVLTPSIGGLSADAFGGRGGQFLTVLMDKTQAPLISRWGSIMLRRTLLSQVNTPKNVNGADFAAARAALLLRMGEARPARAMVQAVDPDQATTRLQNVALDVYMANGDPAGLCSIAPYAARKDAPKGSKGSIESQWTMIRGVCAALAAEQGTAGALIDGVERREEADAIDVRLAEKILGAGAQGRRAVKIEWDGVNKLTPWRFGLAHATGVEIPANLLNTLNARERAWQATAPMAAMPDRVAAATTAGRLGVMSNQGWVNLISAASEGDDASEGTSSTAALLMESYAGKSVAARVGAMKSLWEKLATKGDDYAGKVLTARAAASLPVDDGISDDDLFGLLASMLTAGLDGNAANWAKVADKGSLAWGLLAVGLPQAPDGIDAGSVGSFSGKDPSTDNAKTKMLVAALAGLGRLQGAELTEAAEDAGINLATKSKWATMIEQAAANNQDGTVALLAGVGMQGRGWDTMSPAHLYFITKALREVGLGAEARMIAAEAVARA